MMLQLQVQPPAETIVQRSRFAGGGRAARQHRKPVRAVVEILALQARLAFASPQLRERNQLAQVGVAELAFDQRDDPLAIVEGELAADDAGEFMFRGSLRKPHRAVKPVPIGQR